MTKTFGIWNSQPPPNWARIVGGSFSLLRCCIPPRRIQFWTAPWHPNGGPPQAMWISDPYTCKYCPKFQCDTVSTDSKERVTFPTSFNWINYTKSFWWSLNSKCDIFKWILYVRLVPITIIITSQFLKRHDFPNGSLVDTFHLANWKTINAVYYAKFHTLTFPNMVLES